MALSFDTTEKTTKGKKTTSTYLSLPSDRPAESAPAVEDIDTEMFGNTDESKGILYHLTEFPKFVVSHTKELLSSDEEETPVMKEKVSWTRMNMIRRRTEEDNENFSKFLNANEAYTKISNKNFEGESPSVGDYYNLVKDYAFNDNPNLDYKTYVGKIRKGDPNSSDNRASRYKIDALNMAAGTQQEFNTFTTSKYRPTNEKKEGEVTRYFAPNRKGFNANNYLNSSQISKFLNSNKDKELAESWTKEEVNSGAVFGDLGNYSISKGEDENGTYIAIYDKNDYIGEIVTGLGSFEVYDRIYYTKKNGKYVETKNKKFK